jgi:hypothetical protein
MNEYDVIVDTLPKDSESAGSVNLGLELVSELTGARIVQWHEKLDFVPKNIGINVIYPPHMLNIVPFLRKNGIEPLKEDRKGEHILTVGGPAIGNGKALVDIVDHVYFGEFDNELNLTSIISEPIIKNGKAVIELTRGCKSKCKFCEYTFNVTKYREKDLELVKAQIMNLLRVGVKRINFLSANFAGYSKLPELIEFCIFHHVTILNCDSCVKDAHRLLPYTKHLQKHIKLGIESFDEATRKSIAKPMAEQQLIDTIKVLSSHMNYLHMYMIYGLPNDNYDEWVRWLKILQDIRKSFTETSYNLLDEEVITNTKSLRYEFSITNFEPCYNTPMANAPTVDFKAKDEFMIMWSDALKKYGFFKGETYGYVNAKGRIGRKEHSYEMLMELKRGENLTEKFLNLFQRGVSRSISTEQAEEFLNYDNNTNT